MSHIVVLGAGLGGVIMAYEMKARLRREDRLTVVNLGSTYSFVPSNPWVAVGPAFFPLRPRRDLDLLQGDGLDTHPISLHGVIEAAAGNLLSAGVDPNGGFQEVGGGHPKNFPPFHGSGQRLSLWLSPKNGEHSGGIHNHLGSPRSS